MLRYPSTFAVSSLYLILRALLGNRPTYIRYISMLIAKVGIGMTEQQPLKLRRFSSLEKQLDGLDISRWRLQQTAFHL
jgi:hypothetical protein